MHHGRVLSGVCVVAVVTALSGCGSDTTAQFKSGYNAARGPINQTGQAIAREVNSVSQQTDAQAAASLHRLAAQFQTQLAKLTALKPPSNVASDWTKVKDAASKLGADVNALATAASSHSRGGFQQGLASLQADGQALTQALAPVKQKLGLK